MARRSVLFTPGDEAEMMKKALSSDADAVVFDLEDAVSPRNKEEARQTVVRILEETGTTVPEVCVRVNADEGTEDDIEAIAGMDVDSIVLPKAGSRDDVEKAVVYLDKHDDDARLIPVVESARGVLNAEEIASAERVDALIFGAEDLSADVGATRTEDGVEILYA
ncbi:MAG: aldolase/citrate lyase family protein, partial [Halobacteria archaeon]|nr:aldolase/citrate lyase family protein [Halobacteria archaeon]